jgi:lysine 6-dehydrogenase
MPKENKKASPSLSAPVFRIAVIGGAGSMGKITVRDLYETCPSTEAWEILVADYDLAKAQALVHDLEALGRPGAPKLRAVFVDIRNARTSLQDLVGCFAVINAAQYQLNVEVMEIALQLNCHYVDLGGLFHMTRKQWLLQDRFEKIGRTAILGMGAAPGITNLLAAQAAEGLDLVREIHTRVASYDGTKYQPEPALAVAYSLQTILEEFSYEPAVFTRGQFTFAKPMSGATSHRFPAPIGLRKPMYTLHSEVATLPISFSDRGIQECSFKIAFDPEFTEKVKFLRDLGMASHEPLKFSNGSEVAPITLINRVALSQPTPKVIGKLKQYEVVRAIVKGTLGKKKVTRIYDLHTQGMPAWGIGLDIDTGSPPAIAVQMLAAGEIQRSGVHPPEQCVPPSAFFKRLKQRKMKTTALQKTGWEFAT